MEVAAVYGSLNHYAYYFMDIMVGQPQQRVSVILDTGSSLCGFPCRGCPHCGEHIDPPFDLLSSTTATWLPCGPDCPGDCVNHECVYSQSYTEGSYLKGVMFRDLVRIGDEDERNPPVNVTLGCNLDERRLFYTQRANGIMGLAPFDSHGRPNILEELFEDRHHVNAGIFALCLAAQGGELSVGGYQTQIHVSGPDSGVKWTKMNFTRYYTVYPQKLFVGGVLVEPRLGSYGGAILDSGTTFSYFPSMMVAQMLAVIEGRCPAGSACKAVRAGSKCWQLRDGATCPEEAGLPSLALQFEDDVLVTWQASNYLYQDESGLWCEGFDQQADDAPLTIGASFMINKEVIFDVDHWRAGFAEARCPQHQRPEDLVDTEFEDPAELDADFASFVRVCLALGAVAFVCLATLCTDGCERPPIDYHLQLGDLEVDATSGLTMPYRVN